MTEWIKECMSGVGDRTEPSLNILFYNASSVELNPTSNSKLDVIIKHS